MVAAMSIVDAKGTTGGRRHRDIIGGAAGYTGGIEKIKRQSHVLARGKGIAVALLAAVKQNHHVRAQLRGLYLKPRTATEIAPREDLHVAGEVAAAGAYPC